MITFNKIASTKITCTIIAATLLSACNTSGIAKSTISQIASANGVEVEYDPNTALGKGLPTQVEFNRKYGRDNCALKSYMHMRNRYISAKRTLMGAMKNEVTYEPGLSARLMQVDIGNSSFSMSPEIENTFYVNELKGSQGFGNYKIVVITKGLRCKVIDYQETKL